MKFIAQVCSIMFVALFCLPPARYSATQITCTVTAKKADLARVECKPHKTGGPRVGDKVEFSTLLRGIKVNAGTGKVKKVDGEAVWVKISDDRPKSKMNAHYTGYRKTCSS